VLLGWSLLGLEHLDGCYGSVLSSPFQTFLHNEYSRRLALVDK
jgi:hypothetical protein